jgi:hypothetical protein
MTETMIEPIHPRPLEKKTNTPSRYPVPANRSLRGRNEHRDRTPPLIPSGLDRSWPRRVYPGTDEG